MSFSKKILIGLVGVIVLAVIGGWIYIYNLSHRGLPQYHEIKRLPGLQQPVTIFRDDYAVPHIYAQNEKDLYYATGYVMAQDRLWQMDLLRRVTMGRLSEIFGKDLLQADILFRSLRIEEKSQQVLRQSDPRMVAAAEAFAQGINSYMEQLGDDLPLEFALLGYKPEKWRVLHSINLIGYMAWDLAGGWDSEVTMQRIKKKVGAELYKQLIPKTQKSTTVFSDLAMAGAETTLARLKSIHKKVQDMGLQVFQGSNNWAVSGKKSATGKPILANDMHLGLNIPGIWMQIHQVVPGKLNVTGVAIPGEPFVVVGHNEDIAWGMTNVGVDNLDFFVEKTDKQKPNQYLFEGQWKKMRVDKEVFSVKDGKDVTKKLRYTHHGPVVSDLKDEKELTLTMRWLGNDFSNEFRTIYLLNRAGNWSEFKDAIKSFKAISQNINYADTEGNIGIYNASGIPMRKSTQGHTLVPGWTGEHEWTGVVPFEQKPYEFNPKRGFVSSANNKTVGESFAHYITRWGFSHPARINRINEILTSKDKFSVPDIKNMHTNMVSVMARRMGRDIYELLKSESSLTPLEKEALALLQNWSGSMDAKSGAAALFETFYLKFMRNTFQDEMGEKLFRSYIKGKNPVQYAMDQLWRQKSSWYDRQKTSDQKESFRDILLLSFRQSVSHLKEEMGSDVQDWQWGDIHTLELKHPLASVKILDIIFGLNRGPFALGGSMHTIPQFAYKYNKPFGIVHGPSQRHVYNLEDWDKSYSVIPTGNSGIVGSEHYCDQTDLFVRGNYHPDYFSKKLIMKHARYTLQLKP